jgi:hypothetical protein
MTVTRLAFKLADGTNQIDVARALSQVHRTLVRQKNTFTIIGGMLVDNSNAIVKVSTAPNFWYTKAAINRGFRAWKQMRARTLQNAELENSNMAVGKYSDFKVTLNGSTSALNPIYTGGGTLTTLPGPAEWNHADLRDEAGNEMKLRIVGSTAAPYYGLMDGWIRTRATPDATNEPTMPDLDGDGTSDYQQDFINNLYDTSDGQPERLELVYDENDSAPFTINELYGDTDSINNLQLQSMVYLAGAPSSNDPAVHGAKTEAMIPGFKALCGLIRVDVEQGSNPVLFLDVMNTPEGF